MIIAAVQGVFEAAKIMKAIAIMNGTTLKWQTLTAFLTIRFTAWMRFRWIFVVDVWSGAPNAHILVSMMQPFWMVQATISLALIYSTIIIPLTSMALKLQLLF